MTTIPQWTKSLAPLVLSAVASTAAGQGVAPAAAMQPTGSTPVYRQAVASSPAPAAYRQVARHVPRAAPARSAPPIKPFELTPARPTISPYLQLHREDFNESLPNYFAFVRPQIQQQELLQQQQMDLQRLHHRLQHGPAHSGFSGQGTAGAEAGGPQSPSYHARFLNTGGYFSGVRTPQQPAKTEP